MNADQLLEAFELIGDAPHHVQQLRKLVVALAIAGTLSTDALPADVTAMLRTIEATKAKLSKAGAISRPKHFQPLSAEHLPESFSDVGLFAPLGAVARLEKGLTGIQQAVPGAFPLVVTAAERATCDHFDFEGPAAIVPLVSSTGHGNASINRLHYQDGRFALGSILVAIMPYDPKQISARFLFEYLTAFKEELLVSRMTGSANVTLTLGKLAEVPIPLVSPQLQAKVDELMALLDRLEQARAGREALRDQLTAATLNRLTQTDPEDFQPAAHFALQTLPHLTARPDQIKTLRQTILNLAARGKLVEQDATDEPASELLKRIAKMQRREMRTRGVDEGNEVDGDIALPFEAPKNWELSSFGALPLLAHVGLDRGKSQQGDANEFGYFKMNNIRNSGGFDLANLARIDASSHEVAQFQLKDEDFLFNTRNSRELVGKTCVFRNSSNDVILYNNNILRARFPKDLSSDWIDIWFRSDIGQVNLDQMKSNTTNVCAIYQGRLSMLPCLIPPFAEQHRIVARVDALMALCDQLEAGLAGAAATRTRHLDALLHRALSGQDTEDAA